MSGGSADNARKDPRRSLILKVEYPDAEGFVQDYTVNISKGGTMIRVNQPLAVGDRVDLILSFPGLLAPVRLSGRVRWAQEELPDELTAGVEFDQLSPVVQENLAQLVQRIESGDKAIISPAIRMLVVEDNLHVVRLISDGLAVSLRRRKQPIAFNARHAGSGREALELLRLEPFDIVLLDMFLPLMDGERLIGELKRDPLLALLPIIALGARGANVREQALNAGADFYLDKPVRLSDLLDTLEQLLARGR